MTGHSISDAEYARAIDSGPDEAAAEMRALSVRYVADRDAIEIVTSGNAVFLIPRQWISALKEVKIDDLARLEVWPDGSAIEIEDQDIHISVHGLLAAALPGMVSTRTLTAIFAGRGGKVTSDMKRRAAQANGRMVDGQPR
jgi:hypothetical protein